MTEIMQILDENQKRTSIQDLQGLFGD